ncbi:MAG: HRDC domain-containing protein [Ferruginibacter sp.]|nr:HRDC domain-containing protein [Ferruginibacter sp.]
MQVKLFTIPLTEEGAGLAEMNKFLAGQKVLEVEQRFFQNEKGGCWSFCVRYLANALPGNNFSSTRIKVDYKNILSEAHFGIFSRLREIRKELATNDAVPAYAVFTDEELASIAQMPEFTTTEMQKIKGIGQRKTEKYGIQILILFNKKPVMHEAN